MTSDDGHRGKKEDKEKLKVIVEKLNADYGIAFEEADRVVNAIKQKLEADDELRSAFKTNSIEFLRKQKLQDSIKEAFLSNADEFLNFMSKTEPIPALGNSSSRKCSSGMKMRCPQKHPPTHETNSRDDQIPPSRCP